MMDADFNIDKLTTFWIFRFGKLTTRSELQYDTFDTTLPVALRNADFDPASHKVREKAFRLRRSSTVPSKMARFYFNKPITIP